MDERTEAFIKKLNDHIKHMRIKSAKLVKWSRVSWVKYLMTVYLIIMLQLVLLLAMVFWIYYYRGGLSVSNDAKTLFNFHPLLMLLGCILFLGLSITLYRLCRCWSHSVVKVMHAFLHTCTIPCIYFGLLAAWKSHNLIDATKQHFYSFHSWLGCFTITLIMSQLLFAYVGALFSWVFNACFILRHKSLIRTHALIGIASFLFGIATAVTGLLEKQHDQPINNISGREYFPSEYGVIMTLCTTMIVLGLFVVIYTRETNTPTDVKFIIRDF